MDSTIKSLEIRVVQTAAFFSAHAIINGKVTTQSCNHVHGRYDLAEKCLGKLADRWVAIQDSDHEIILVPDWVVGSPIYEIAWSEMKFGKRRSVNTRFCIIGNSATPI